MIYQLIFLPSHLFLLRNTIFLMIIYLTIQTNIRLRIQKISLPIHYLNLDSIIILLRYNVDLKVYNFFLKI